MRKWSVLFFVCLSFISNKIGASHGMTLISPSFTVGATGLTFTASSDGATCGGGPYWLQVELRCTAGQLAGTPPASMQTNLLNWAGPGVTYNSFPWYNSLLNVPNYSLANSWSDACVTEPYNPVFIPFSSLCPGQTYWFAAREWVSGSNSVGPWTTVNSFVVPGTFSPINFSVVANPTIFCAPGSSTLTASAIAGGCGQSSITWLPGNSTVNPIVVSPAATTNYTAVVSTPCNTLSQVVTVSVVPGLSITTASTSSCTVGSATAVVSGGVGPYTYTWSPIGGNSSVVTAVPPGIYTVAVKDASCSLSTSTINIPSSPTVSVTNSTICSGASGTLTASGASTYSWNTGATSPQVVVSPTISTNYTVTGSNGSCSDTKTVSVIVNASPTVNIAASNTIMCAGQSATLTASGGNSYLWNTGSTNTVIVVAPISNTTYTVTGFASGCSGTKTISIAISALPSVSVSSSNSLVCSGNSATLTVSGSATSYTWSTGATTSQIVVSPSVNTTYTVVGSNGVCSVSRSIAVTSGTTPTITAMTSNSFICAGQTITLSATGGTSYTYNPGAITGNPVSLNPSSNTTYTVVGSNGGPCTGVALITQSVSACTGISHAPLNSLQFELYPNPNNGEFGLSLTNISENNVVEIYNCIGQLVKKQLIKETTNKISISDQPDGVYYLRIIQNETQVYKARIIKK